MAGRTELIPEIDRLRGVAITLVVVCHTLSVSRQTGAGGILFNATMGATWTFVFIAGYLLAHLHTRYTFAGYLRSKATNVLAPYVLMVCVLLLTGLTRLPVVSMAGVADAFLFGFPALSPLWFLPMIAIFYAGFPFYKALCGYPRTLLAVTGLAIVFSVLMGRPPSDSGPLLNFAYFQSAYLSGLTWRVYRDSFDRLAGQFAPLVLVALVVGAVAVGEGRPLDRLIFSVVPATILLMHVLRQDSPLDPAWNWLASRSFGIFFLHGLLTDNLPNVLGNEVNVLLALAISICIIALCGFAVSALRAVAGPRSRLLVGA